MLLSTRFYEKGFASNGVFVAVSEGLSVEGRQDGRAVWSPPRIIRSKGGQIC
jgi:hypothetical protein